MKFIMECSLGLTTDVDKEVGLGRGRSWAEIQPQ